MFGFLNTAVLFAAAAALVPLVIHLFSRRRVKVVEFSSLKHLKAMQRRQVRRLKIRQLLLLLMRMLIIFVVVLAFARPTTERGGIGGHASVAAVVLFDNSASMNRDVADGNLFDLARQRTRQLIESFGQSDEVCVIPLARFDSDTSVFRLTSPAIAFEQADRVRSVGSQADFRTGMERAIRLLSASDNLNKEIYIVTDRQRASLPEDMPDTLGSPPVYLVELPLELHDNLGITDLDLGGQLIEPGVDFEVQATIRNYRDETATERLASLFVDGRRVAQSGFSAPAGGETVVRFSTAVTRTGFHDGYVEMSDDKFRTDNRYYFSFDIPERFNLLIVSADESSAYFRLALVPNESLSRFWSVKEVTADQLTGVDFSDYDVVFMVGIPTLNERFVRRLQADIRRGTSALLVYSPDTDLGNFTTYWSSVTGVTFTEPVRRQFSREGFYTLSSLDLEHPIFSVFSFDDNRLPEIKFFTLPQTTVSAGLKVLMAFSGDRPALVETRHGSGKVLTFTGPAGVEYTDLAGQAFFVPFVSRAAEYLASDLSSLDLQLFCGDRVTRTLPASSASTYPPRLITPDSLEYRLNPQEQEGALVIHPQPLAQPGIYAVRVLGTEMDRFAVNVNPAECDLDPADSDQLADALQVDDVRPIDYEEEVETAVASFRYGRELWQVFVWMALVLLAVEMFLSRGRPVEE